MFEALAEFVGKHFRTGDVGLGGGFEGIVERQSSDVGFRTSGHLSIGDFFGEGGELHLNALESHGEVVVLAQGGEVYVGWHELRIVGGDFHGLGDEGLAAVAHFRQFLPFLGCEIDQKVKVLLNGGDGSEDGTALGIGDCGVDVCVWHSVLLVN